MYERPTICTPDSTAGDQGLHKNNESAIVLIQKNITMFKLLKSKKSTEQIIAEIHNEFDSASERLLQEAKDIVLQDTSKGDRLRQLGFNSAKPVKEIEEIRKTQHDARQLAERVSYFSQWYPHNKFITEEAVQAICEKYGLVFASTQYYKGDVPEKNLLEMEKFVLRKEDEVKDWASDLTASLRSLQRRMISDDWGMNRMIRGEQYEYIFPSFASEEERPTKNTFKICAPEKDFDTSNLIKKGHKLELNIPDPIVLQPVKGGYLIVTKWGLEASDELVKNEKAN
jgi:hypothetical protein